MHRFVSLTKLLERKEYKYLIIFVLTIIIYYKTIYFDFNLDDFLISDVLVGKTNTFKDLLSLFKLPYNKTDYRPIVFLSYGIEQFLLGEIKPNISHAVNTFIFFLICISSLKLFSVLFDKKYDLLLFTAVVLFCVHPLNTEVVSSLKSRDNLLSMFFGLHSTIFFIYFIEAEKKKLLYLFIFIILSALGILSKLDAIGFLIFNIAYAVLYKKDKKVVYVIISMILAVFIVKALANIQDYAISDTIPGGLEGKVTLTENPLAIDFTLTNSCVAFVNTLYYYFTKLIPISGYRYYYGYNYYQVLSTNSISFIGGIFILISFTLLFIFSLIKQHKILTVSIVSIFVLSFYALNFYVPVAGIIADRYVFMANLFFCLFLVYLLYLILKKINLQKLRLPSFTLLTIIFAWLSFNRTFAWKDQKKLIDTDAPYLFTSYEAMRIAAATYYKEYENEKDDTIRKAHLEKAIFYAEKGVQVYPKNYLLYLFLGQYYFKDNQYQKAITCFRKSTENDSTLADANTYLGDIYYTLQQPDSSLFFYQKAFALDSSNSLLINNISTVYYESGQKSAALQFNKDIIQQDSTAMAAWENLGYYYLSEKDTANAILHFKKAIKYGLLPTSVPILMK